MRLMQMTTVARRAVRVAAMGVGLVVAGCVAPPGVERTAPPAGGGDALVILTGGGTPVSNEYSHYLQARAMGEFFRARYPAEAVWTFFGVGNRTGAEAILADVHRQTWKDGVLLDSWFPGELPENRPATKAAFLKGLKEEILPRVAGGGTLYLFIGDHGELSPGKNGESAVTMWQLRRTRGGRGWESDDREILTVSELRAALAAGLGKGRVVFGMTQCHSGGFHFLGVPRDVAGAGGTRLRIAGFTATDADSLAAGCDPDPDPENWAGYERYFPQALLGTDLMTGARSGGALASFAEAHEAATLVDHTIDKPYGSSDQYLLQWADHIETKLLRSLGGTAAERAALADYERGVDAGGAAETSAAANDPEFLRRAVRFRRFTSVLARENPGTAALLERGTRRELEAALQAREPRGGGGGGRRRRGDPLRRVWTETLRPAWKKAVAEGAAAVLPAVAVAFEKSILEREEKGRDFFSGDGRRDALLNEVYWQSGLSEPVVADPARAEAVTRWAAERRQKILEWAKTAGDGAVRTAAATIERTPAPTAVPAREPVVNKTAVERGLMYRRELAAWRFLVATDNRAARAWVAELIALEETPLPPTSGSSGVKG